MAAGYHPDQTGLPEQVLVIGDRSVIGMRSGIVAHESITIGDDVWFAHGIEFDAVGGLTMGADPVATAMLHAAAAQGRQLDAFVVRKAGKAHGLQQRIEGPSIKGKRVLVVEDTTTTGNSPLTAVAALREAGAEVVGVATVVDRATGAEDVISAEGLEYRSLLGLDDLGLA